MATPPDQTDILHEQPALLRARWGKPAIIALLISYCSLLWIAGLGWKNFYDLMETSRAVVAREMVRANSYAVPVLDGHPYLKKPPLFLWSVIAAGALDGGVNEFSTRLPSALSAIAIVLILFLILDGPFTREQAFLAAIATATNLLMYEKAVSGQVNMMFSLWVALSILALFKFRTDEPNRTFWFLVSTVAFGLALLTKGPPVIVFWLPILLAYLWRDKGLRLLRSPRLLLALPLLLAVALPWPLTVIHRCGWDYCYRVFYQETFVRLADAGRANRGEWWFYLVKFPVALMPWMLFIPLTFRRAYASDQSPETQSLLRLLRISGVLTVFLFSFSKARELRYVLPIVPMMCALGAHAVVPGPEGYARRWIGRYVRWSWIILGLFLPAAAVVAPIVLTRKYGVVMPDRVLVAVVVSILAGAFMILTGGNDRRRRLLVGFGLMAAVLGLRLMQLWLIVEKRNDVKSPRAACLAAHRIAARTGRLYVIMSAPQALRFYADAPLLRSAIPDELLKDGPVLALVFERNLQRIVKRAPETLKEPAEDEDETHEGAEALIRLLASPDVVVTRLQTWRVNRKQLTLLKIAHR